MSREHKPGTLVNYRGRDWIVMPSDDVEVLNIKEHQCKQLNYQDALLMKIQLDQNL